MMYNRFPKDVSVPQGFADGKLGNFASKSILLNPNADHLVQTLGWIFSIPH